MAVIECTLIIKGNLSLLQACYVTENMLTELTTGDFFISS